MSVSHTFILTGCDRKNCRHMSKKKTLSTSRFTMKRVSLGHSGAGRKPTSRGVPMAVKMSAMAVSASQHCIIVLCGSMIYHLSFFLKFLRSCAASNAFTLMIWAVVICIERSRRAASDLSTLTMRTLFCTASPSYSSSYASDSSRLAKLTAALRDPGVTADASAGTEDAATESCDDYATTRRSGARRSLPVKKKEKWLKKKKKRLKTSPRSSCSHLPRPSSSTIRWRAVCHAAWSKCQRTGQHSLDQVPWQACWRASCLAGAEDEAMCQSSQTADTPTWAKSRTSRRAKTLN